MFVLLQTQLVENVLSGWADEPHEQILYVVVTALVTIVGAVVTYIANQLRHRSAYTKETARAAEQLSTNPRSSRAVNGKENSATLLNWVIEDQRESRDDMREIRKNQESVLDRLERVATKDDIARIDVEVRDLRRRLNELSM